MQISTYLKELDATKINMSIDNSWYYHDFRGDLDLFANILAKGILCKKELGIRKNTTNGYNGMYYISITKYSEDPISIFKKIDSRPLIIISNKVKAIKTKPSSNIIYDWSCNTPLPFRTSSYSDEWQIYKKISSDMFVGVYYDLLKGLKYIGEESLLEKLFQIVECLDHFGLDLPIIDGSDKCQLDKKVIRKIKF